MSQLHELRRIRAERDHDALVALVPYACFLGICVQPMGEELVSTLPFADHIVGNPLVPALHGGAVGSLLEFAAVYQVLWGYDLITVPKTVNITIDYLRPGKLLPTYARARVTKQGRRIVNVAVHAWQTTEVRPIATAQVHLLVQTERSSL